MTPKQDTALGTQEVISRVSCRRMIHHQSVGTAKKSQPLCLGYPYVYFASHSPTPKEAMPPPHSMTLPEPIVVR